MNDRFSLFSIVSYARGGAVDYAWRLLREGGYDRQTDDPAALCVVGRLLKDKALEAPRADRRRLFADAAEAYARAGQISGAAYPLINAATLSLVAGQTDKSKALALRVLNVAENGDQDETPYYRGATRAEALLLLGDVNSAKASLAKAISLAPRAYEDHASTLRQFALILGTLGEDGAWLDAHRPPRCLHFAGHMGLASDNRGTQLALDAIIEDERVGWGFGALAAGADILVAEALIAHDAELHVLLPSEPSQFREVSVVPAGFDWALRFDRVLERATTVSIVSGAQQVPSAYALQLATEMAMGRAVMQAQTMSTEPIQLIVLDGDSGRGDLASSQWTQENWASTGRRQRILILPRGTEISASDLHGVTRADEFLGAFLRIGWPNGESHSMAARIAQRVADVLQGIVPSPVTAAWVGDAVVVAFNELQAASNAGFAVISGLKDTADISVAGHYGVAQRVREPFHGGLAFTGRAATLPQQVWYSTPPGAFHVTEEFAAALYAGSNVERLVAGYVGDLSEDDAEQVTRLFALRAIDHD